MGFSFIRGDDPDQVFLLPPDAREWLPQGHLARRLLSVVGEVDLDPFLAGYRADGRSRPAYHPESMLALVMYCYCKGVRSSRAIEAASFDDLGARVIMGNQHPDHATIARFVTRHADAVKQLLVQTLVIAARDGLLRVDVIAGDGTVVKANASAAANATAERLGADITELQETIDAEVEAWFAQAAAEDAAEDALFDDDDGPAGDRVAGGPGSLTHTVGKLLRHREAKTRLEQRQAQRAAEITADRHARVDTWATRLAEREQAIDAARAAYQAKTERWQARADAAAAAGKKLGGPHPVPVDQHSTVRRARTALAKIKDRLAQAEQAAAAGVADPVKAPVANTTDPASRSVPGKNGGGFLQGYNVQVTAARGQIILGIGTHDSPTDTRALHPDLQQARDNLDAAGITDPIKAALFDAGYASDTNFTTPCPDEQTTLLVAVKKEARQTGRLTDDHTSNHTIQSWQQMAARLDTDDGRNLYRQRGAIVEPVFAQLFNRLGRWLNYRGSHVDTELNLWAGSHNIGKIIRHRHQPAAT